MTEPDDQRFPRCERCGCDEHQLACASERVVSQWFLKRETCKCPGGIIERKTA